MLLRISRDGDTPGIEMVTIDAGPGVPDAGAAMRDGHSTGGTLGIGLGAIRRLADFCDLYSAPGHGTVLVARFWPEPRQEPVSRCAGLDRPITGETECGDVFAAVGVRRDVLTGVLCDGLGHGPLAATAANEAVARGARGAGRRARRAARAGARANGQTRGGALGDRAGRPAEWSGSPGSATSRPGSWRDGTRKACSRCRGSRATRRARSGSSSTTRRPGAAVILHSDGLSSRWEPRRAARPGRQ